MTIAVGFAGESEVNKWTEMVLPEDPAIVRKVNEMKSERIGINVRFSNTLG
jgi:hypothetical protein